MNAWPAHPVVHEINTWVWLDDLSNAAGRPVTLGDVPDDVWDDVGGPGIDAVWLMGVWERSPAGARIARSNPEFVATLREALPDLTDADVVGSAYCIRRYAVDERLGGNRGLALARAALAGRGVRLVLDLVPNHVAPDHPWVETHPEYFIQGTADDLARDPVSYLSAGGRVFACGRDPYFPAWTDVVQLDTSRTDVRAEMAALAVDLTTRCDGVRCDMAMLMLDDVFTRTWGDRASGGPIPDAGRGYWPTVIAAARAARTDFAFWAEAYWDREPDLVGQGFDACYDKRLYDRLVHGAAADEIRTHLGADPEWQRHTIRFVENHDEPRAATEFTPVAHRAALATTLTVPGVALLHEGGVDGRRVRIPVMLGRRPHERTDPELRAYVARLLAVLAGGLRQGSWALAQVEGWPDNGSAEHLGAWTWTGVDTRHLVVVNFSGGRADGMVRLPWTTIAGRTVMLGDTLSGARHERDGDGLTAEGLYVGLDGHGVHLFVVD